MPAFKSAPPLVSALPPNPPVAKVPRLRTKSSAFAPALWVALILPQSPRVLRLLRHRASCQQKTSDYHGSELRPNTQHAIQTRPVNANLNRARCGRNIRGSYLVTTAQSSLSSAVYSLACCEDGLAVHRRFTDCQLGAIIVPTQPKAGRHRRCRVTGALVRCPWYDLSSRQRLPRVEIGFFL